MASRMHERAGPLRAGIVLHQHLKLVWIARQLFGLVRQGGDTRDHLGQMPQFAVLLGSRWDQFGFDIPVGHYITRLINTVSPNNFA
jgi:hypothetical protein